ncbi:MAG: hypothetical protein J0L94_12275 [Rhodothermia bacterium]|nr:hypothetical protein [Rhodothermia bacterium]
MSTLNPLSAHIANNASSLLEAVYQQTAPLQAGDVLAEDVFWILRKHLKHQVILRHSGNWRYNASFTLIRMSLYQRNIGLLFAHEGLDDSTTRSITEEYGFDAVVFAKEQAIYEDAEAFAAFVAKEFPYFFSDRGRINLQYRGVWNLSADADWRVVPNVRQNSRMNMPILSQAA